MECTSPCSHSSEQVQTQTPSTIKSEKSPDTEPKEHRDGDKQTVSMTDSKKSKVPVDIKQETMERIVGEIGFQLDRRILSNIFPDQGRLYGFTVSNIPQKISQGGNHPTAPLNKEQRKVMMERYANIMNQLTPLGYDLKIHPTFTEYIVNTYGILVDKGLEGDIVNNCEYLQKVIASVVPAEQLNDCLILLACLAHLSKADGKPLFIR